MAVGWVGQPKGLLQVLWERGLIDHQKYDSGEYSLNGKAHQKDEDGNILPTFNPYLLRDLMEKFSDFQDEPTEMEQLMTDLSSTSSDIPNAKILTSPKFHCEIAGEGIEYNWGLTKLYYRKIPLEDKISKSKFNEVVKTSIKHVTVKNSLLFAAKARRYMLAYMYLQEQNDDKLTHCKIEKLV